MKQVIEKILQRKVKKVYVKPIMSVEESDTWAAKILKQEDCKEIFNTDVDVYCKESGICLAKFRKGIIPGNLLTRAYDALLKAATPTDARLTGTGDMQENGTVTQYRIRKDGSKSKQVAVPRDKQINSGIIGYYDRTTRFPYCRLTAFNMHEFEKFKQAYPVIKFVDLMYAALMPEQYKKQRVVANKSSQDFVIKDTSFSTVTVNKNYTTAVHKDAGDFKDGFGNLVALRKGTFVGCNFTLVRWGIGFDLQNGDLLLTDVHQWHGNTPMIKVDKDATRLSLVMYYRENIIKCGSAAEELKRVKTRKQGEKL